MSWHPSTNVIPKIHKYMNRKVLPILMSAMLTGYTVNSSAQVNKQLSNLATPTAVNQNLLPSINNDKNLGSSTRQWKSLYLHDRLYLSGLLTMYSTANDNFFIGPGAGTTSTSNFQNTGIGTNALHSVMEGMYNTATGFDALYRNYEGGWNTATGVYALYNNDGNENTATGVYALRSNTYGDWNTAMGTRALWNNKLGSANTAHGVDALYDNTMGSNNTATGWGSLYSNTAGDNNTANGFNALSSNTKGIYNTAVGSEALWSNTTGTYNTAIGASAGDFATGSNNTFIGYNANSGFDKLNNATAIGYGALVSASNQVRIGGKEVTSIGGYVNWSSISDKRIEKNIKSNVPGLAFINKLKPITYTLDVDAADKIVQQPVRKTKDGKTIVHATDDVAARQAKEQLAYTGFVAQEVEKAAKELEYDFSGVDAAKNDNDMYGLRYSDFVPPLVKAVQELSSENKELKSRIEKLETLISRIVNNNSPIQQTNVITLTNASLENNAPNPVSNITRISYVLPQNFSKAQLSITDKSGTLIKMVPLSGAGRGSVEVDASPLTPGTYSYSLSVDGRLIATKDMVVVK